MINKHVEEYLDYFCGLAHSPDYAVLIKGAWGSGKTWFINKYIEKLKGNNKKYLYVSLYGVSTISEIEDSFFQQLHPILSSKGMAITGKILKGALKATLKIDLDGDKKSDATVTSQIPDINIPDYLKDTSNCIIIFDDLERCNLNLEAVLGYINHFVEHQGLKVILVANEDEIFKEEAENPSKTAYRRIKEKLIGKTLGIAADVEDAIDDFVSQVDDSKAKQILIDNKATITSVYETSGYENLRNLKQSIWDFERLYCKLPEDAKAKVELIQRILGCLLALSFELRKGSMLPTDILRLHSVYYSRLFAENKDERNKDPLVHIIDKYQELAVQDPLPNAVFWRVFFDKGVINQEEMLESIYKSIYFINDNTPAWIKLWHFYELKDEEFTKLFSSVEKDYEDVLFEDIGIVKHVTGIFLRLSSIGLYNKERMTILAELKKYIDNLQARGLLKLEEHSHLLAFERDSYKGLQFMGNDLPEFNEMCDYIEKALELATIESMPDAGKDLLSIMTEDFDKFSHMVHLSNSKEQIYYEVPIFKFIAPSDFVKSYMMLEPEYKRRTAFVFEKRYRDGFYIDKLIDELDWLKNVRELLIHEAREKVGKVSGYVVKSFVESYLDKIIATLDLKKANKALDELSTEAPASL